QLEDEITLDKRKNHTIEVVVDRLLVKPEIAQRLEASVATATKLADGLVLVAVVNAADRATCSTRCTLSARFTRSTWTSRSTSCRASRRRSSSRARTANRVCWRF